MAYPEPIAAPLILLAPGASGTVAGLRPYLDGLAARGISARGVELPKSSQDRAVSAYRAALEDLGGEAPRAVIGGQSFGGRMASILAAEVTVAGLVLLAYPLHAPGRQQAWIERTAHWKRIQCPVLLLSGDADPFARPELLRRAVRMLPEAELVSYPGVRHGVGPVLEDALDRIAAFVGDL